MMAAARRGIVPVALRTGTGKNMLDNLFSWDLAATLGTVQDGSAVPGGAPVQGAPAGGGNGQGGGGSAPLGGNMMLWIMPVLLVMLVFMTVMGSRREKAERAKRADFLKALGKNDRVVTTSGIIGSIVELKDDEIVLKVDDANNTRIRFTRAAVQEVVEGGAGLGRGGLKGGELGAIVEGGVRLDRGEHPLQRLPAESRRPEPAGHRPRRGPGDPARPQPALLAGLIRGPSRLRHPLRVNPSRPGRPLRVNRSG